MFQFPLPKRKVSGGYPISNTDPATVLLQIPAGAKGPARVFLFNTDATAVVYLKWIPLNQTNKGFATSDAGILLEPTSGYADDSPPQDSALVAKSSVNNSIVAVDANWYDPDEGDNPPLRPQV